MLRTSARLVFAALAASLLSGCSINIQSGDGQPKAAPKPPPPRKEHHGRKAPTPPPPVRHRRPTIPATATRITEPNAFGNGKEGAFVGLAYVIPENTKRVPTPGPVPFAALFTDKFEVQSKEFTAGFPGALLQTDWFMIRYEGEFDVPRAGTWQFRLVSDDGALLYVDDKRVVDNDGVHTAKSADGEATLTRGLHWLRLDYFQASKGQVALQVLMGQNGRFASLAGTR
jgi:hypothetical protein